MQTLTDTYAYAANASQHASLMGAIAIGIAIGKWQGTPDFDIQGSSDSNSDHAPVA